MAVDVRRGGKVAVTQPFLDLLHGHVVGQQERGAAVPEIVKTDSAKAVLLKKLRERRGQIMRRNQSTSTSVIDTENTRYYCSPPPGKTYLAKPMAELPLSSKLTLIPTACF